MSSEAAFETIFYLPLKNGLTKSKKIRGHGFKMVNMGEFFSNPRINNISMDRVPLSEKEKETFLLTPGDLLFARQSLVREGAGKCSIFLGDVEAVCFESHLIRCRLNFNIANPHFYFYYFNSIFGKNLMNTIIEQGAGAAGIRGSDLAKLIVPIFPKKDQDAISKILSSIDEKIEFNTQINKTLEEMAQAIFKSWFVDFDPVKARMAALASGGSVRDAELAAMRVISGKDEDALAQFKQEDPDAYKELAETAALFPSDMQESELGDIPEGWEVVHAEFFLELAYGKALKKDNRVHGEFPVYGSGGITGTHIAPIVDGPGIIVGRKGTIGSVYWEDKSFYPIDTTFYVIPKQEVGIEFIYFLLKKLGLDNMNTDAAVPGLNRNNVYRLEVPHYSDMLIKAFSRIAKKYLEVMNKNKIETENLTQIRDTLLPKLLAGEINLSLIETDSNEASL